MIKKININELKSLIKKIINENYHDEGNDWSGDFYYHPEDPPDDEQIKSKETYKKANEYIFNKPLSFKKDVFLNQYKNWQNKTGINKIFPDYTGGIYAYTSFLRDKFNARIPNNLVDELLILGNKHYTYLAHISEKPDEFLKKNFKNEIYNKSMISALYEYLLDHNGNGNPREEIVKFILADNRLYKLLTTYGYGNKPNLYLIKRMNRIVNKDKIELLKKEFLKIQSKLEKLSHNFNDDEDYD